MPVTMQDVLAQLGKEEPDYNFAAQLGRDALPHLLRLVQGDNLGHASKATCLASFIEAEESATVLRIAAHSSRPSLRAAAAVSLKNVRSFLPDVASRLFRDENAGVRKWTLKALQVHTPSGFRAAVIDISKTDPDITLRRLATQVVERLR